jgi:hypothetical protein
MSSFTSLSPDKLVRLIGMAKTPVLIDVRTDEDFAADPRLLPGAVRRSRQDAADWGDQFLGSAGHRRLPARPEALGGYCGVAPARQRSGRSAGGRV